jgi:hypothetical protein
MTEIRGASSAEARCELRWRTPSSRAQGSASERYEAPSPAAANQLLPQVSVTNGERAVS